jgi:hypothetical protein
VVQGRVGIRTPSRRKCATTTLQRTATESRFLMQTSAISNLDGLHTARKQPKIPAFVTPTQLLRTDRAMASACRDVGSVK